MKAHEIHQPTLNVIDNNTNLLSDHQFENVLSDLIASKFTVSELVLERKPKADKGV